MNARRMPAILMAVALLLAACGGGNGGGGTTEEPTTEVSITLTEEERSAARDLLRNAHRAANAYFDNEGEKSYTGFDAEIGAEKDPSITWVDNTDPGVGEVSITQAEDKRVHFVTKIKDGAYGCARALNQFGGFEFFMSLGSSFERTDEADDCIGITL